MLRPAGSRIQRAKAGVLFEETPADFSDLLYSAIDYRCFRKQPDLAWAAQQRPEDPFCAGPSGKDVADSEGGVMMGCDQGVVDRRKNRAHEPVNWPEGCELVVEPLSDAA